MASIEKGAGSGTRFGEQKFRPKGKQPEEGIKLVNKKLRDQAVLVESQGHPGTPSGFVHDKRSEGWEGWELHEEGPKVEGEPTLNFLRDGREGWELLEEGPKVEGEPTLNFLSFLREGETLVNGETILARALEMDGSEAGQHHLEALFAQASSLPAKLRKYTLFATGTKWRDRDGEVFVPVLHFNGLRWVLQVACVTRGRWRGSGRVVRVK